MKDLLLDLLQSSIGRKFLMALTGLGAIGFLITHLGGNLTIYWGSSALNAYAHHLHSIPFLWVMELGLAGLFLAHIALGVLLTIQNWRARPQGYAVHKSSGNSNFASSTMIYSGAAIMAFMVFHIINMKFGHAPHTTEFDKVSGVLAHSGIAILYVLGVLAFGMHLFHGASSTFQSLGIKYPKLDSLVMVGGRFAAVVLTVGFASVPLFVWLVLKGG